MSDNEDIKPTDDSKKGKDKGERGSSNPLAPIMMQGETLEELGSTLDTIRLTDNLSKVRLQTFQNAINAELDTANKCHAKILGSTKINDTDLRKYLDSKTHKRIKETYWLIIAEISERLEQFKESSCPSSDSMPSLESEFRLPAADLPTFSRRYDEWIGFQSLFTSTIHNRTNLDPVQKLHYLIKATTGEAHKQIKGFTLTNENYMKAWELLDDQYNHPRTLANIYLKKMLDYKSITTESSKELRNFVHNIKDCLASLECLNLPTGHWDCILLFSLQRKVPSKTFSRWEEELGSSKEIPKFKEFLDFLESRFRTLEMIEGPDKDSEDKKSHKALHTKSKSNSYEHSHEKSNKKAASNSKNYSNEQSSRKQQQKKAPNVSCLICKLSHATAQCNKFRNNPPAVRRQLAAQYKLCFNCLGTSHTIEVCYSTKTCIYCKKQHHSLLHIHENSIPSNHGAPHSGQIPNVQQSSNFYASSDANSVRILGTALIRIVNSSGYSTTVRALLDSGADDNFIINAAVQNSGLKKYSAAAAITGLNDVTVGSTDHKVNFQIQSLDGSFEYDTSASVVETITSRMPPQYIEPENFGSLNNLPLADPNFNHPGKIHVLLGVGFIVRIRKAGLKRFKDLIAEQTLLGWVVMGQCSSESSTFLSRTVLLTKTVTNEDLSKQIQKFFTIEEFSEDVPQKPEDALCDKKFLDSVRQGIDGKLIVELPFREDESPVIGPSRHIALRRFLNLEKKLDNNPMLKEEYSKTITDYLNEGHLVPVTVPAQPGFEYFLPHHAVVKESSTTTKLRVVFDGSCKSADTTSLNDHLLTGPKLQADIRDIFFNWRKYEYALTADIAKMYRMFWVDEKHRNYQKILWRFHNNEPISEYCLSTVTFGTNSAPFQAIRALHYIAEREGQRYPVASKALLAEFYVDDFISGAHTIPDAIRKQQELRNALGQYGLSIRKWSSNSDETLQGIASELKETLTELTFEEEEFRKTLGVFWAPKGDYFSFSTSHFQLENNTLTKRTILSLIARLYDPMGWVGPSTLHAKIIMQRIWEQNLNWDEEVCGSIGADFEEFLTDLHSLTDLKIPRWVQIENDSSPLTLYGFSDASLKAYGAVLYLLNPKLTDSKKLILLTSRTRVKPLKHITLARLELCAAVMLSELISWAKELLKNHSLEILAYSDSKIVLSWIKAHPSKWKMYVAGRTTKILESTSAENWFYVNTKHNPADLASRGLLPSELVKNSLWWNGPKLEDLESTNPELSDEDTKVIQTETKEVKSVLHTVSTENRINSLVEKYSSHGRMCRVMQYITVFLSKILLLLKKKNPNKDKFSQILHKFSYPENQIFRHVQSISFPDEIKALRNRQPLPRKSRLNSLNPFLDGFGILRIGGRLQNAAISYNQKHPIILPSHHQVSTNLIQLAHHATLHGDNSETESYLRHQFHILRCSERIKFVLKGCPKCVRLARQHHEQLMGSLPSGRVNPHRPFLCTGVDYAGPFNMKAYKGRCNKILKGYIALFVCFCTKALHLEVVSELTATAFLAAFRRFVNRRGHVQTLQSDCGTNFIKGAKLLQDEISKAQLSWKTELEVDFVEMGTKWKFNPPGTPHFGGLWEAGVKSVKTHLKKTFGIHNFTQEELNTVLVQIEGILNSRPLCPLKADPRDFSVLTPAHFLIGESIVSPPDRYYDLEAKHPVDRWQFLQKLKQMFWMSWKKEYLHKLNTRSKWKRSGIEFKENDIVILTDENTPATYWPKAIILSTHPGKDNITRVVTLKTDKGQILKRPTSKLRLLAFNPSDFQMERSETNSLPTSN